MSDAKSDAELKQNKEAAADAAKATEQEADKKPAESEAESPVQLESFDGEVDPTEVLDADALDPKDTEIEQLKGELDQARDQLMRAVADAQNSRKRFERDRREAETYGGTKLARDITGVYDNLSKALSLVTDDMRASDGAFVEGLELTQRELLKAFSKHGIKPVEPEKGEKFDPNEHEAMFEAPFGDPGTVIEVVQIGFMIADRLLRPAKVGVASANAKPMPAPAAAGDSDATEESA
ncbi:MAG: nucleotide exchange factor GrpE [Neomegalonema sp.]|nr:nucleotide exchange factor GrpE [Neomegalonema sp.]